MNSVDSRPETKERFLIPVMEVSHWLGIPAYTLYSWAQAHRIPHYKIGKRVMFSKEELKLWLSEHRVTEVG